MSKRMKECIHFLLLTVELDKLVIHNPFVRILSTLKGL